MTDPFDFLFDRSQGHIRIPIWGHIPLDQKVRKLIGHPHFFRLRGIKQLSFVEYVFPGATHSRFEHSLGVWYLTTAIFQNLVKNPLNQQTEAARACLTPGNIRTLQAAALLHDLGHYPHAHLLENQSFSPSDPTGFVHHQELARDIMKDPVDGESVSDILSSVWQVDPDRVFAIITGDKTAEPLGKIVSGILDPDKMDYLIRDAHHCAVPYASVDIWRLIESFMLDSDRNRLSVSPKGIASFESLMFSKYMMTRHIYWHHTVKTLGTMLKRLIQDLLDENRIRPEDLKRVFYESNDEQVLSAIHQLIPGSSTGFLTLLDLIIKRKPYKKLLTIGFSRGEGGPGQILVPEGVMDHRSERFGKVPATNDPVIHRLNTLHHDPVARKQLETHLAGVVSKQTGNRVDPHDILLDIPGFHTIFEYRDLDELRIWNPQTGAFDPFVGTPLTVFQPDWISRLETSARQIQILIHPRHADLRSQNWSFLKEELFR